jgi:nitrate/nitrite transporter NarK
MGWAATTNYTNHAAVLPVLMAELGFGPVEAGFLSTAFFVTLGVACVPAGLWCDRRGPTGVGTAGLLMVFASNLLLGAVRGLPDLVLVKVLGGLGCALAFVAGMRYAALVVEPARVPRALGFYGGFVQLGGGTSLYLVPLLASRLGWRPAFVISSGLVALSTVAWWALAPAIRPAASAAPLTEAMQSRRVWTLGLVHTATFGLAVLTGIWITTFLVHEFDLTLVHAGAAGSAILALGVLSRPLGGLVVDRGWLGAAAVMRLTVLAGAIGLLVLAWPGRPLAVAALAIGTLGVALNAPYAAVMQTTAGALPRAPGAAVGLVSGIGVVSIAAGAPAVGALLAATGGFALPLALLAAYSLAVRWALSTL